MGNMKVLFCLILAASVNVNEGYRILCVFPFNGWSHFSMFEVICKGLAKKGHQIDMISHFPTKTPIANYTDIIDLQATGGGAIVDIPINHARMMDQWGTYYVATEYGSYLCRLMGTESMQKFIKNPPNDPPYDLVITEHFGSPCYIGFGELLNVPVVVAVSTLEMAHVNDFMGNPYNYAFFSGFFTNKPVVETFFDRLWNMLANYKEMLKFHYYTSGQTALMKKYLGLPGIRDIRELEKTVALAIVNSHHSLFGIRPTTPALIEVAGLHLHKDVPKLSPEVQNWLDSADNGLVYFSLGSLLQVESLPKETLLALYASFAKIAPLKVLMKSANATRLPPGLPSNTITAPWVSQISVLKHKNTRAFITHGGLMGTQEAVYYGVPMIGIPIFIDQIRNVNILKHKNMARVVQLEDITENSMGAALNAVLHDSIYRESAKRTSKLFRDRPLSAIDTATYWIEYIIRNGPNSLRSPALDLPWWKLHLIDVFAFLIFGFALVIYLFTILLRITLRRIRKGNVQTKQKVK